MEQTTGKTNIFWTGGLDSTFRVVQLLMSTDRIVQPHYMIDGEESSGNEIDTMNTIRRRISRDYPGIQSRFLPTIYVNSRMVKPDEEIRHLVEELRETQKVDKQYQIMSYYCKQFGINQMEVALTKLSAEKDTFIYFRDSPAFKYFSYPTLIYSKPEMYHIGRENGWDSWLDLTSFCRRPKVIFRQCGTCGPCVDAVREGRGSRLHPISRIKAITRIPFWNYRHKHSQNRNET
jgi:hypothetical protein